MEAQERFVRCRIVHLPPEITFTGRRRECFLPCNQIIANLHEKAIQTSLAPVPFAFSACTDKPRTAVEELKAFEARPVALPLEEMACWQDGKNVAFAIPKEEHLKFVVYSDSLQCSSCNLKRLPVWENFLRKLRPYEGQVKAYFIFRPLSESLGAFGITMRTVSPPFPVFVDTADVFLRSNPHFPSDHTLHTFLIGRDNRVLVVGDPLTNERVDKLLWKVLEEQVAMPAQTGNGNF